MSRALSVLALGVVIFPAALLLHEVFHLVLLAALGGHGLLVVRPWRFQFLALALPSLHVSGAEGLAFSRRVIFDFGGPGLAALLVAAAGFAARTPAPRTALYANAAILIFFAAVETADYLLDWIPALNLPFLGWEEFNYGVPLLVLGASGLALVRSSARATR
ncbi:MAG: hypothetical protein NVS9B1_26770 [Candidatus Dormibacteraceae bacterium]